MKTFVNLRCGTFPSTVAVVFWEAKFLFRFHTLERSRSEEVVTRRAEAQGRRRVSALTSFRAEARDPLLLL